MQLPNAASPMLVTESGIVTLVRESQLENAYWLIEVIPLGKVSSVSLPVYLISVFSSPLVWITYPLLSVESLLGVSSEVYMSNA